MIDKIKDLSDLGGGGGLSGLGDTISDIGHTLGGLFHVSGHASGTNDAPGGLAMVGEKGPELVELPAHSRVYTAAETKKMLSGAGYSSIVNGLSSGLSLASAAPASLASGQSITLNNIMTGSVNIDGREIGRIAFRQIDKNVRLAYGN